ncbi:MAG: hypothetical protein HYV38_02765 [Candidatus Levybacteria bacterium]|nr:hypothetical protein [Candidatus Levybacteria bacterium]
MANPALCTPDSCENSVQFGQWFHHANALTLRRFNSKASFFALFDLPTIQADRIMDYFAGDEGAWVPNPDGSMHYSGPYQLVFVPLGWIVKAYGNIVWTAGYLVGADDFMVVPDYLIH